MLRSSGLPLCRPADVVTHEDDTRYQACNSRAMPAVEWTSHSTPAGSEILRGRLHLLHSSWPTFMWFSNDT